MRGNFIILFRARIPRIGYPRDCAGPLLLRRIIRLSLRTTPLPSEIAFIQVESRIRITIFELRQEAIHNVLSTHSCKIVSVSIGGKSGKTGFVGKTRSYDRSKCGNTWMWSSQVMRRKYVALLCFRRVAWAHTVYNYLVAESTLIP